MSTWTSINAAASDQVCRDIAAQRGIRPDFFAWLRDNGLFGCHQGHPAFPVHDSTGQVVGIHHLMAGGFSEKPRWGYTWLDGKVEHHVSPLILGDLDKARQVLVFESQWDAFSVLAELRWHIAVGGPFKEGTAALITRGAQNGKLVSGLLRPAHRVLAFPQNDQIKTPGNPTPAEKWLNGVVACAGTTVFIVKTPEGIKDVNDWLRTGAKIQDFASAMSKAVPAAPVIAPTEEPAPKSSQLVEAVLCDPDQDPASQPFPTDALPYPFDEMIRHVARIGDVPEALPGCLALSAISTSVTGGLAGKLIPPRITPSNTYLLGNVRSGNGKSTAFEPFFAPIYELERSMLNAWRHQVLPSLLKRRDLVKEEIEDLKKARRKPGAAVGDIETKLQEKYAETQLIEDQIVEPCLVVEDVTTEKLAVVLEQNQERTALISSDGGSVVDNLLGRRSKLNRPDDNLYVKAFSGDPVKVHRQTRPSVSLAKPLMTMLMLVQGDKVSSLMSERQLMEGGLMARFLFATISTTPAYLTADVPDIAPAVKGAYCNAIQILLSQVRLRTDPVVVEATPEARQAFREYYNRVVDRRRAAITDIDSFAARHAEQAARLALLLHAARWGAECGAHELDLETAQNAIRLAEWFAREQMILLQAVHEGETARILTGIERFAALHPEGFAVRDLQRVGIIEVAEQGRLVLEGLVARGLATMTPEPGKTRPRTVYRLIPRNE